MPSEAFVGEVLDALSPTEWRTVTEILWKISEARMERWQKALPFAPHKWLRAYARVMSPVGKAYVALYDLEQSGDVESRWRSLELSVRTLSRRREYLLTEQGLRERIRQVSPDPSTAPNLKPQRA